jgi:uncharacterized protein
MAQATRVMLEVPAEEPLAALLHLPAGARALYLLAPGAGAGMEHPFLRRMGQGLVARGIGALLYQFPYMQRGSRRPDPPPLCHATVRAAVAAAQQAAPGLPLIAGGKSFGGRMSSQAQATAPLPGVLGLAFLGFPLHPAGRPGTHRAEHLARVSLPMLFLQGTRDELAERALLQSVVDGLGARAHLAWLEHADHAFHVPARSGRRDEDIEQELLDVLAAWIGQRCAATGA